MSKFYRIRTNPDLGIYFKPSANAEVDESDRFSQAKAARFLGVNSQDVKRLIEHGHLRVRKNPNDGRNYIPGDSLLALGKRLEPVDLVPVDTVKIQDQKAASAPQNAAPKAQQKPAEVVKPKEKVVAAKPVEEADTEESEPAIIAPCPHCRERIGIDEGIYRFACPSCGNMLEVEEPESEPEPEPEPEAGEVEEEEDDQAEVKRNPWFGFLRARRR